MPKMSAEGSLDLCMHWQKKICHKRVTDQGDEQETSIRGRKTAARAAVNCWFLKTFVCLSVCLCLFIWVPSVLWRCWLCSRKSIRPVKKHEWWGAGMVICLERCAELHMAQLMPLPLTVSCFSKIQIGLPLWYLLTRVVPEKGPLNGCVCVCVC